MPIKPKRKVLNKTFREFYYAHFDGKLEDVIAQLWELRNEAEEKGFFDLYLEWDSYDDRIYFYGKRYETDKEYEKRVAKERKERETKKLLKEQREKAAEEEALFKASKLSKEQLQQILKEKENE